MATTNTADGCDRLALPLGFDRNAGIGYRARP